MQPWKPSSGNATGSVNVKLVKFSNKPDDVATRLTQVFDELQDVRVRKDCRAAQNVVQNLELKTTTLRRCISGGFGYSAVSYDSLMVGFSTKGGVRMTAGAREIQTKPYEVGEVMPAGRPIVLDKAPGSMLYLFDVSEAHIVAHAETLLGHKLYRGARDQQIDLRGGPGSAFVRNTLHLFHEIDSLQSTGVGLAALVSFEECLLNLAIYATRPDLLLSHTEPALAPAIVHRAKDYIAAHAENPVRIADVAAALGVSTRTLQTAFKRHVGCSPLEFLLRCRLEIAHARLLTASPRDTVTSIAAECGFLNFGFFARRYRLVYGDVPSQTLKRTLSQMYGRMPM